MIAWDGTTLAADKRAVMDSHTFTTRKIYCVGDALVGFSGAADRIGQMREWLAQGADPATYPTNPHDDAVFMIVVHRDGRVLRYEDTAYPIPVEDRQCATGSGRDFARAAMHLGCDAVRAVEVACLFDEGCGNGVDSLTFDEPVPPLTATVTDIIAAHEPALTWLANVGV